MSFEYRDAEEKRLWDHLSQSEERFQRRHQDKFMKFVKEVNNLKNDFNSYVLGIEETFQTISLDQEEKRAQNKNLINKLKHDKAKYQDDIAKAVTEKENIEDSIHLVNERLKELTISKDQLLEERNSFIAKIRKTYAALNLAKDFFKSNLKLYLVLEDAPPDSPEMIIRAEFFTGRRTENSQYCVTIARCKVTNKCRLISTKPTLSIFAELSKRLSETGDIPGLLCCARNCFIKHNTANHKAH